MTSEPGAPRTITVLTSGRQDWGILRSVCVALREEASIRLDLVAGGMHLSARHGRTVDLVVADGFEPSATLDWLGARGTEAADDRDPPAADQAGAALAAVGAHLRTVSSDALVRRTSGQEVRKLASSSFLAGLEPVTHLERDQTGAGSRVGDRLDPATREQLEQLRRGQ